MLYSVTVRASGRPSAAASRVTGSKRDAPAGDDRCVDPARPALEGADPRNAAREIERLDQVIVRPGVEAWISGPARVARSEHQERVGRSWRRAQRTTSMPEAPGMRQSMTATSYS